MIVPDLEHPDDSLPEVQEPILVVIPDYSHVVSQIHDLTDRSHELIVTVNVGNVLKKHQIMALALIASAEPVIPITQEDQGIEIFFKNSGSKKKSGKKPDKTLKPPKILYNKGLGRRGK